MGVGVGEQAVREPQGKRWGNVSSSQRRPVWSCIPCLHAWEEATSDPEVWSEFLSPPSSPRPLIQKNLHDANQDLWNSYSKCHRSFIFLKNVVLLPRKSRGQRSLVGCSPWGR